MIDLFMVDARAAETARQLIDLSIKIKFVSYRLITSMTSLSNIRLFQLLKCEDLLRVSVIDIK